LRIGDCDFGFEIDERLLHQDNPQSAICNPQSEIRNSTGSPYFAVVNKVLEAELRATGLCYNLSVFHKTPAGPQG